MKRITAIALLAIANLVMAGTSFAQSNGVAAKVPFPFAVGDKVLPAGYYTLKSKSSHVLMIKNPDQSAAALILFQEDGKKSPNGGKLVFHKYGDQYFLSEVLCDSAGMHAQLPTSKREKKTAQLQQARLSTSSETLVAAR
jgi:hypothetical protein